VLGQRAISATRILRLTLPLVNDALEGFAVVADQVIAWTTKKLYLVELEVEPSVGRAGKVGSLYVAPFVFGSFLWLNDLASQVLKYDSCCGHVVKNCD
jgi:hypothetical protein